MGRLVRGLRMRLGLRRIDSSLLVLSLFFCLVQRLYLSPPLDVLYFALLCIGIRCLVAFLIPPARNFSVLQGP
jgi:hypothetical protein